jgi:hypothetical protein
MPVDDRDLFEAIGRVVIGAAELEYAIALLVAVTEGLRRRDAAQRAVAIVKSTGRAMRLFERLAAQRPDLAWLQRDAAQLMRARHFIAHPVVQQDAVAEGSAALFILNPKSGEETMITTAQVVNHVQYFKEERARIYMAIANELAAIK